MHLLAQDNGRFALLRTATDYKQADALAGAQASCWLPATSSSFAIGSERAERALGDGLVPSVERTRWLGSAGPRDRVLHSGVARMASLPSGRSKTAEAALKQALIARFGTLGRVPAPFLLPSDNGLVFTSRSVHRHRFETLQHASPVIGDWIAFYNNGRPHQSVGMKTAAEASN